MAEGGDSKAPRRRRGQAARKRKAWLPEKSSVIEEKALVSPKGRKYRIVTTTEMDPYDRPPGEKGTKGKR
jgi:hypothetical protein